MAPGKSRILHLFKSYIYGGIELSTIDYFKGLEENFDRIYFFAQDGPLYPKLISTNKLRFFKSKKNITYNLINIFINLINLITILRTEKINIINYHHRFFLIFIYIIRIISPKTIILYTSHNRYNDFLSKLLWADHIISVSKSTSLDSFRNKFKSKITRINHGIEINNSPPIKTSFDYRIGFVGRFEEVKGIKYLLEAFEKLSRINPKFRLVLVGSGSLQKLIEDHLTHSGIKHLVEIRNNLHNKRDIYSLVDLLVLPAIQLEGFGLVLIEAINYGIPVIGSKIGGIPEIIINNETGLIINPADSEAIVKAVLTISNDDKLRKNLIEKSKAHIKSNFDIKNTLKEYSEFYTNISANSK